MQEHQVNAVNKRSEDKITGLSQHMTFSKLEKSNNDRKRP